MFEQIEKLRDKLNKLILHNDVLSDDEILKVSQELDKLISLYYFAQINEEGKLTSA